MATTREHRPLPGGDAARVEARAARRRTSAALGLPAPSGEGATPPSGPARLRAGAALLCLAGALAGCEPVVQGNGVYLEEGRQGLGTFAGVFVDSGVEATVTAGAPATSVTVSGDSNVVPEIETVVVTQPGGRRVLQVRIPTAFTWRYPPRALIALPELEYASAAHGSRLNGRQLSTSDLEVEGEHGATLVLEGAASPAGDTLEVKLGTGAVLDATAYHVSGAATVALSGASVARLRVDGPVSGTLTGASQLDDTRGTGSCTGVVADATSRVTCR